MGSRYWCILAILVVSLVSGCLPLPAPSTLTVDDKLYSFRPLEQGDTILIHGENAPRPHYFGEPYFSMGCMLDYEGNTLGQLIRYMLKFNPVPGQFSIKTEGELQGDEPAVKFSEPAPGLNISASMASRERLRYVIVVREKIDTTLHIPLYVIPFGISACGNESALEAFVWDVPSGTMVGTITISSSGEFIGLAWLFHIVFLPQTQSEAVLKLAMALLTKLTGVPPDDSTLPVWHERNLPI
jgi:hypothetical protein